MGKIIESNGEKSLPRQFLADKASNIARGSRDKNAMRKYHPLASLIDVQSVKAREANNRTGQLTDALRTCNPGGSPAYAPCGISFQLLRAPTQSS